MTLVLGGSLIALLLGPTPVASQVASDSVRPYLVFRPVTESWFVAANRGKRMMLDIGRVDLEVRKDSAVAAAYRRAVGTLSPLPLGTRLILHGPWGTEEVTPTAVDSWNGRIVLLLSGSAAMSKAVAGEATIVAAVTRAGGGTVPPSTTRCDRTENAPLAARVPVVRDSLIRVLRAAGLPPYPRLASQLSTASSQVTGCFDGGRVALAVSLRTPTMEWARQRLVLIDERGAVQAIPVDDLRLKAHDLLHALDADGDGLDDLAAVGRTDRGGATSILRYDRATRRFVRLATGFAWEDR